MFQVVEQVVELVHECSVVLPALIVKLVIVPDGTLAWPETVTADPLTVAPDAGEVITVAGTGGADAHMSRPDCYEDRSHMFGQRVACTVYP